MYLGKMVENTTKQNLFTNPMHPYTQALMSAVPIPDPRKERSRKRISLIGELPSAVNPPPGCNFHTRCPIAKPNCKEVVPTLEYKTTDHSVSCIEVPIQK
jgi:oligopeptide/dipeptide ABC transporter ATP-binding protein